MARSVKWLSILSLFVSCAWFWRDRDFEPMLAVIGSLVGLLVADWWKGDGIVAHVLHWRVWRVFWPIQRAYGRRRPVTRIGFKTLRNGSVTNHVVDACEVWERGGPTAWVELRHRSSALYRYTFDLVEGHHPKIALIDFNGDGVDEIAVLYSCGAHTQVLSIYVLDAGGIVRRVPGGRIGSDWLEISWEDKDGDGRLEIYAKQRNWSGGDSPFVVEQHVWTGHGYHKQPQAEQEVPEALQAD